jgi:hypothetical protein
MYEQTSTATQTPYPTEAPIDPRTGGTPAPAGYLAAMVGGGVGAVALAVAGGLMGAAMIPILEDPDGGMANLGLLLIPVALAALGIIGGTALGVWVGLTKQGHRGAIATAGLTIPFTMFVLGSTAFLPGGTPLLLVGTPALARWIVLRATGYRRATDSSRSTSESIGGNPAASSASAFDDRS